MLLAEHGTFHHVYDFTYFELPFGGKVHLPPLFGLQLTKFMLLQVMACLLIAFIFRGLSKRIQAGNTASGWWWNFWEMLALYIRDEVVRPVIGDPHAHHNHDHVEEDPEHVEPMYGHAHRASEAPYVEVEGKSSHALAGGHPADEYLPYVWSCFFYVLVCNLLGAFPWLGSATGNINVTGALAITAFGATFVYGARQFGVMGFWGNLSPEIDAPGMLKPILTVMLFVIEALGLLIKHTVLAVRLFANIMGGHTALGVILGFIATTAAHGVWWVVMPASIAGQVGVSLLELLFAFIQAYVFAFLSTIFIGMSLHPH